MVANAILFPAALRFRQLSFHPDVPSRSGGQSTTGYEQVTVSGAGRWRASGSLYVAKENAVLAYRAMIGQLQGRAGTILLPAPVGYRPKNGMGRWLAACPTTTYAGDALHFDVTGWGQTDETQATLYTSAILGATQIAITLLDGTGPRPGHYFGIADRTYLATHVWQEADGDPTQIRFWPPLRAPANVGTRVILDRPLCLMRLADDASGELMLEDSRFGEPTMAFVEAL